jgi:hypothetical protein
MARNYKKKWPERTPSSLNNSLIDRNVQAASISNMTVALGSPTYDRTHLTAAVILVTFGMGALDSISLLHLNVFTGYMTGIVILVFTHIVSSQSILIPGLSALVCLLLQGPNRRMAHPPSQPNSSFHRQHSIRCRLSRHNLRIPVEQWRILARGTLIASPCYGSANIIYTRSPNYGSHNAYSNFPTAWTDA